MNKNKLAVFLLIFCVIFSLPVQVQAKSISFNKDLKGQEAIDLPAFSTDSELKNFCSDYKKYSNEQNIDSLMNMYDKDYISADKFDKKKLKELAEQSWAAYPKAKYDFKILSMNAGSENATVVAAETISGETTSSVHYIKGFGYIDSKATTIYYLKKYYDGWKIISDYIIDEKTSLKYGVAKDIEMKIDAPPLLKSGQEYSAIFRINVPKDYIALVSLNNEPITFPIEKSQEVFRTMKSSGIQERILKADKTGKNENAVASVGIARADIKEKDINIKIVGIAFLTSRINISHPMTSEKKNK